MGLSISTTQILNHELTDATRESGPPSNSCQTVNPPSASVHSPQHVVSPYGRDRRRSILSGYDATVASPKRLASFRMSSAPAHRQTASDVSTNISHNSSSSSSSSSSSTTTASMRSLQRPSPLRTMRLASAPEIAIEPALKRLSQFGLPWAVSSLVARQGGSSRHTCGIQITPFSTEKEQGKSAWHVDEEYVVTPLVVRKLRSE
jgi:hypothetical protein